jgi:hypothetical protein
MITSQFIAYDILLSDVKCPAREMQGGWIAADYHVQPSVVAFLSR